MGDSQVAQVAGHWPGRRPQINRLSELVSGGRAGHLLVHGPPATGKTAVIRHCLEAWQLRHAYVNFADFKLRQLLAAILSQLWGLKRKRGDGYCATAGADNWNEFAEEVVKVCPPGSLPTSFLVLDSVQWAAHSQLLPPLMAALQVSQASLSLVLITCATPHDMRTLPGPSLPAMHALEFPAYNRDQLVEALSVHRPSPLATSPEVYRAFLEAQVVDPAMHTSRALPDLITLAAHAWPLYTKPLHTRQVNPDQPNESLVRQLNGCMQRNPALQSALRALRPGVREPSALSTTGPQAALASGQLVLGALGEGSGLQLSKVAKLLLLAAFIASRNKPTLDKALFDYGHRRGRNRAGAGQAADRQAEAAKEARLKGPHTFPLQRLIAIFHRLWAAVVALDEDDPAGSGGGFEGPSTSSGAYGGSSGMDLATGYCRGGAAETLAQSGRVLTAVTSLEAMSFIVETSTDDPLDNPKYVCCLDEPVAQAVARDVGVQLNNYLMYDR